MTLFQKCKIQSEFAGFFWKCSYASSASDECMFKTCIPNSNLNLNVVRYFLATRSEKLNVNQNMLQFSLSYIKKGALESV